MNVCICVCIYVCLYVRFELTFMKGGITPRGGHLTSSLWAFCPTYGAKRPLLKIIFILQYFLKYTSDFENSLDNCRKLHYLSYKWFLKSSIAFYKLQSNFSLKVGVLPLTTLSFMFKSHKAILRVMSDDGSDSYSDEVCYTSWVSLRSIYLISLL